ncbi:MAG: hypothetical protein SGPRY_014426 [Prymnesium sp.]
MTFPCESEATLSEITFCRGTHPTTRPRARRKAEWWVDEGGGGGRGERWPVGFVVRRVGGQRESEEGLRMPTRGKRLLEPRDKVLPSDTEGESDTDEAHSDTSGPEAGAACAGDRVEGYHTTIDLAE